MINLLKAEGCDDAAEVLLSQGPQDVTSPPSVGSCPKEKASLAPPEANEITAHPPDQKPKHALVTLKFTPTKLIPQPPRKENGRTDWPDVSRDFLAKLAQEYPIAQVAEAWGISSSTLFKVTRKFGIRIGSGKWTTAAAKQRREVLQKLNPPPAPVPRKPVPWERKGNFLRMMWEIGAPTIAVKFQCDVTILCDHAKALKLPTPPGGYFSRNEREMPAHIAKLIKELEMRDVDGEGTPNAISCDCVADGPGPSEVPGLPDEAEEPTRSENTQQNHVDESPDPPAAEEAEPSIAVPVHLL